MANLFDALQKHLGQQPAAPVPAQSQIQASLAAKSGKASAGGSTPRASNIGESAAIGQAKAEGQQIALQGQEAGSQLQQQNEALDQQAQTFQAGQQSQARQAASDLATQNTATREQLATNESSSLARTASNETVQTNQINAAADQKLKQLATERQINVDDIFADFESSNKELEFRKDAARLEQAGFLMAMRDKSYVDELQRVGQERGLQDELAFNEEMNRLTWGDQLSDLLSQIGFQSAFNGDQRAFDRDLANIDAGWALKFAEASVDQANKQAMIEGTTSAITGGLEYAAKTNKSSSKVSVDPYGSTSDAEAHNQYESQVGDGMLS